MAREHTRPGTAARPRHPDWLFDDDSIDDDEDCLGDCGLMPDGQCMLAGTEFCDWECGGLG